MATYYIDGDALVNGSGTFASPYNIPPSAADSNTYLFKEGSTTALTFNWSLSRTDITLGTYDASTGAQLLAGPRKALVTITATNTGTVAAINVGATTRCTIRNLEIINEAPNATNRMGIYSSSTTVDLSVTDCSIHRMRGATGTHNGIQLVGSSNTNPYIARNVVYDVGEDGLHFQASTGLIVEDNHVHDVGQDGLLGDCVQIAGNVPNFIVTRNTLDKRNGGAAKQAFISSAMTSTGGTFSFNTVYADETNVTCVFVEQASAQVLSNRIFGGSQGIEVQGSSSLVQGNVVVPSETHGSTYIGIRLSAGGGIQVYGNTVVAPVVGASTYGIRQVTGTTSYARNNIIQGFATGLSGASLTEDHNCFFGNTSNGVTPTSGVTSDPLLRADYMPAASVVRTSGSALGGVDLYGMAFATTIGAVQYQSAIAGVAYPQFLYDNRLLDATPAASTTATGYDAANVTDLRPYSFWQPTAMPATITIDCATASAADFAAIWGHDLYTSKCWVEIRASTDNFSASDVLLIKRPILSDQPFILPFDSVSYRYWRIKITGVSIPTLAIALIGEAFPLPRLHQLGFDPTARSARSQTNRSVSGYPLGKVTTFEEWSQSVSIDIVTWAWIRDSWIPAWKEWLRDEPFLYAWDSTDHPAEVYLVTAGPDFKTPTITGNYAGLEFTLTGVAT